MPSNTLYLTLALDTHVVWGKKSNITYHGHCEIFVILRPCFVILKDISEIDIAYNATNGQDEVTPDQTCFVNVPHGVTQSASVLVSNHVDLH